MLKYLRHMVALLTLSAGSLSAYVHPCPQQGAIDIEFLYLKPSVDDTYFVVTGTTANPIGDRVNNDFDFHPAFRIGGYWGLCDFQEVSVFYTRLRTDTSHSITAPSGLRASIGSADVAGLFQNAQAASSKNEIHYHRVDAFYGVKALNLCKMDLYLQTGFEYSYVRFNEDINYVQLTTFGTIEEESRLWGFGPQFGFQLDYAFWNQNCGRLPGCLTLNFVSTGSLLVSKSRASDLELAVPTIVGPAIDVSDDSTWRIVPVLHARVGINYALCFSCLTSSLEVGYEFNTYNRAISRLAFPDDVADGSAITKYTNFDLHGLYVALGITF